MPVKSLKGMVKKSKTGKSLKDLERYWRFGKEAAKKAGLSGEKMYKYAMAIVKKRSSYAESAWNLFTENQWIEMLEELHTLTEKEINEITNLGYISIYNTDNVQGRRTDTGMKITLSPGRYELKQIKGDLAFLVRDDGKEFVVNQADINALEEMNENNSEIKENFSSWWADNVDSEEIYDAYVEYKTEMKQMGFPPKSFEKWARDYYEEINESLTSKEKQNINENDGLKGLTPIPSKFEEPVRQAINFAKSMPGHGAHGKVYYRPDNKDFFLWLDNAVLSQMGYPTVVKLSDDTKIYVTYSDLSKNKSGQYYQAVNIQVVN